MTVTLKVQLPPAASEPPVRAIVLMAAVLVTVPPHCEEEESAIDSPAGKTSVNATPVSAWLPPAVLFSVNDSVEFEFLTICVGENDFESVGAAGASAQPVKLTLSRNNCEELTLLVPIALILKYVVPLLVAAAEILLTVCQLLGRLAPEIVFTSVNEPTAPVVLEYM